MKNVSWNQLTSALNNNRRANFVEATQKAAAEAAKKATTLKDHVVGAAKSVGGAVAGMAPVLHSQLEKSEEHTDRSLALLGARLDKVEQILIEAELTTDEELDQIDENTVKEIASALKGLRKAKKETKKEVAPVQQSTAPAPQAPVVQAPAAPQAPAQEAPKQNRRRLNFDQVVES